MKVKIPIISQAVRGIRTLAISGSDSISGELYCRGMSIPANVASQPAKLTANQNGDVASSSDSTLSQFRIKAEIRRISHAAGSSHQRNPRIPQSVNAVEKACRWILQTRNAPEIQQPQAAISR